MWGQAELGAEMSSAFGDGAHLPLPSARFTTNSSLSMIPRLLRPNTTIRSAIIHSKPTLLHRPLGPAPSVYQPLRYATQRQSGSARTKLAIDRSISSSDDCSTADHFDTADYVARLEREGLSRQQVSPLQPKASAGPSPALERRTLTTRSMGTERGNRQRT